MAKIFNITGMCIPQEHYIADMSDQLTSLMAMVARGDYFTINRPRQYGKTTILYLLEQQLGKNSDYLVLDLSFEGIDSPTYEKHEWFITTLLDMMIHRLELMGENPLALLIKDNINTFNFSRLSTLFTKLVQASGKKIALMIDEVDKSANNQLFLDFLGMLREKYQQRKKGKDHTFHSVILAGVHDIKTLKAKIHPGEKRMYNSPWNIAVDFESDLSLFPKEIASMLREYSTTEKVDIDISFFAENLFYFTSGYPFLVSSLCKIIAEKILPNKKEKEWQPQDLEEAVRLLLMENNTNFDTLIKNLENNPGLYEFVFQVIINGLEFSYNPRNPIIQLGTMYGILKKEKANTRVHNRLYEQLIYDYMTSKLETSASFKIHPTSPSYILENGSLNIEKVIRSFQEFMKEQYSSKDRDFLERNGRLLFLAFIRPIINGKGFDFKEVQVSEEKRLDIVITFLDKKHIIELKIWRGESYHREGIFQLCDYLERQNQPQGYLIIFDLRRESGKVGEWEKIPIQGKEIFAAWV